MFIECLNLTMKRKETTEGKKALEWTGKKNAKYNITKLFSYRTVFTTIAYFKPLRD